MHVVGTEVSGNQTVESVIGQLKTDVLGFVRPLWPHILIAAGNYDLARAQVDVDSGRADLIAFGRDFIANPDLVTRLRDGYPLAERRTSDWYGTGAEGYTNYPRWNSSNTSELNP
jgi:N-ethylmaleimide reductase